MSISRRTIQFGMDYFVRRSLILSKSIPSHCGVMIAPDFSLRFSLTLPLTISLMLVHVENKKQIQSSMHRGVISATYTLRRHSYISCVGRRPRRYGSFCHYKGGLKTFSCESHSREIVTYLRMLGRQTLSWWNE